VVNQAEQESAMKLGDYIAILRRRKLQLIIPFILILAASVALAYTLPPVFRSEATILIQRQEVPEDLVTSTVTGYVQEQIESLKQQILTPDNLWDIAQEFNLYPEDRRPENRQEIVQLMEGSTLVEMVEVEASDPETAQKQTVVTVAFTVSFAANSPTVAQAVTARLAGLFMQKNREARVDQSTRVTEFLGGEAKRLSNEIADYETKLAAFKQKNVNQLPELSSMNMKLYDDTENDLETVEAEIQALETRRMGLQSQLAITEPYEAIMTPEGTPLLSSGEQLSVLTAQYLDAISKYSNEHPDVIRLKQEIESLEGQSGAGSATAILTRLTQARDSLAQARQKYSEAHPDVQRLQAEVTTLEQALRSKSFTPTANTEHAAVKPNNPEYVSIKIQLDTVLADLNAAKTEQARLTKQLAEYERRIARTPVIESEYQALTRGYDAANLKYNEIKDKQLQAQMAQQLEAGAQGQKFMLVQPAFLPSMPESPNRIGLALLGVVFAFSGGIGSVSLAEYMDHTIHGYKGLMAVSHAPPLAVIPLIDDGGTLLTKHKQLPAAASVAAVMLALALTLATQVHA
jgi:polysaccharide biosynthesis transport protein